MGAFNTKTVLAGSSELIPAIAENICTEFSADGYEVHCDSLLSGGRDISITKGGMFKAVVGMKTALKITLIPTTEGISFDAGVGIFGQQALPTVISMLFFWPVLLTQIWGLIEQSSLDDRALEIAQNVISANPTQKKDSTTISEFKFCTNCGTKLDLSAKFCRNCGQEQE
jgi:hypothetical protein